MTSSIAKLILATALVFPLSAAYAAEGAATGSGTSTLAGPAKDGSGPSKTGSMSSPSAGGMKSMQKGGATGAGENKPTATGGQPGGSSSRN